MPTPGLNALSSMVQSHGSDLSPTVEMYLKAIVRVYDGEGPVSTSVVARELSVSAASASAMLKRLDADGYVSHEGRLGVIPTASGTRVGALTLRRQCLAERLLVDHLNIPWELAAAEACRLEHAISPLVEHHLAAFVGNPTTCPHGHPIPNEDGTLWRHDAALQMSELAVDAATHVLEVGHDMPELLRFLAEIGLLPGAEVVVKQRERIAGLMTLGLAEGERTVSLQLGKAIVVHDPRQGQTRPPRVCESAGSGSDA
jgi:DtxR family Mn-dependent transcriptional regulator